MTERPFRGEGPGADLDFSFRVTIVDRLAWLQLQGEIDLVSAGIVRALAGGIDLRGTRSCTIDLAGVDLMDAAGIGALCALVGELRLDRPTMVSPRLLPIVERVLRITGTYRELVGDPC